MMPLMHPQPRRIRQRSNSCSSTATPCPEAVLSRFIQNVNWRPPQQPPSPPLSVVACPPTPRSEDERPPPRRKALPPQDEPWEHGAYSYGTRKPVALSHFGRKKFLGEYEDSDAAKESGQEEYIGLHVGSNTDFIQRIKHPEKAPRRVIALPQPSKLREVHGRGQTPPGPRQSSSGALADDFATMQLSHARVSPTSSRSSSSQSRRSPNHLQRSSVDESSNRLLERRGSLGHTPDGRSGTAKPKRSKSLKERPKHSRSETMPAPPTRTREFLVPPHRSEALPPHSPAHSIRSNGVLETGTRRDAPPRRYSTTEAVVDARAFWPTMVPLHRRADSYPVHYNVQSFEPGWNTPEVDHGYLEAQESATAVESDFHHPSVFRAADDVRRLDPEWTTPNVKQDHPATMESTIVIESDPCSPSDSIDVAADESFDLDDILHHYQDDSSQPSSSSPLEMPRSPTIQNAGGTTCFACERNIPETESFAKHLLEHAEQREEEERSKDVLLIDFSDDI